MVESEEAVAEALLKAVGADDHEPEVVGMVLDAMHRAARDDHFCATKYGDDWAKYKAKVPAIFVPHVW